MTLSIKMATDLWRSTHMYFQPLLSLLHRSSRRSSARICSLCLFALWASAITSSSWAQDESNSGTSILLDSGVIVNIDPGSGVMHGTAAAGIKKLVRTIWDDYCSKRAVCDKGRLFAIRIAYSGDPSDRNVSCVAIVAPRGAPPFVGEQAYLCDVNGVIRADSGEIPVTAP
jgi:hypothetical protein